MTALETALHNRLKAEGRHIISTVIPTDGHWKPDGELLAQARWVEEQPLKLVK